MEHRLRRGLLAATWVGLLWLAGCGGGGGDAATDPAPPPPPPTAAAVAVQALALDGTPVAGVQVRASSGATALTDAQGKATLSVPLAQDVTLAFSKADIANQVKVLRMPAGSTSATLDVTLIERQAPLTVSDIAAGGTVSGKDGVRAEFPAGSLVNAAGQVVTGAVQVQMTPVNVLSQTAAFPGRFAGTPAGAAAGAAPVAIVSFGTAEFVPTQGGQKLQVAPGKAVIIEIPMYADRNTDGSAVRLGQVIPLWSLNESTGVWLQEGTGTVVASPSSPTGLALRASVSHFTWWNCDDISGPKLNVNIRCLLLDAAGNPTVPMAAGQVCTVTGFVPDSVRRPVQQASVLVGPNGLADVEIPANTVVELSGTSFRGGALLRGLTSVNFPPGVAVRDVVIALVNPVDVDLVRPATGATLPPAATASALAGAPVDRVELFLGGVKVGEDASAPFDFAFDTSAIAEGFTNLQARAVRNNIVVGRSVTRPVIIDRSAPVVTLVRLNATAGDGRVELLAQVSDLSPIALVEFFRGNTLIGQSTVFPFSFNYTLQPGDTPSVDFTAQARDPGGNLGTSNVISFGTLAPTVSLARSPATATINQSLTLTFTATAASRNGNGINRVEFFKGSIKLGEDSTEPYQQDYTVTGADELPPLSVTAKAIDNAGIAATASLTVPVNISSGDAVLPTVALDAIASPVTNGALELAATANDNVAVAKVEFSINGVFQGERTAPVNGKYRLPVDVSLFDGLTTFEARAFDAAGNTASSTQTATVRIVATLLAGSGDQLPHNQTGCAPSMAFAADGTPFVAHIVGDPSIGGNDARVSRRVGGVWQSLGNANDSGSRINDFECATIAMAAGDVPFVAFVSRQGRTGSGELRQLVRRLNGVNWETSREILAGGTDLIQVAADPAGRPVIVWSGTVFGSDIRLNVERFNGTGWDVRASGFGSLGGQGAGAFRFTVRPDNDVVIAGVSGIGAGGQAVLAFRVSDAGTFALADASRVIDQVGGGGVLGVLDVAANASEIVVAYGKFLGSQSNTTRVVRFNEAATRWDLVGREDEQLSPQRSTALAFQGGTLVQVASGIGQSGFGTEARRLNGASWSGLTPLQPVRSAVARTVVDRGVLFIVYTHLTECCGPGGVGVARLNVP